MKLRKLNGIFFIFFKKCFSKSGFKCLFFRNITLCPILKKRNSAISTLQ